MAYKLGGNHKKIYFEYFGYSQGDYIPCEIITCPNPAVDIHHIICKGMGGSKHHDFIENLQALCRDCHNKYGDNKKFYELLTKAHSIKLRRPVTIEGIKYKISELNIRKNFL